VYQSREPVGKSLCASGFPGLGNPQFGELFAAGWVAFIHRQQALVAGDQRPRGVGQLRQLSAPGRVAPRGAALDADDVAGETHQDRREGGAPCTTGDLPDGGSGDPTGIVPSDTGADWAAATAHTGTGLMPTERNSGNACAPKDGLCR